MTRRRLILRRVDPWSVLKFGFVVNIALMLVALLGFWILWIVVGRLGLVDQFCNSVGSIFLDLQECALNGANIFRTLLLLGLLGVIVQTGLLVFGAFLYNLISDLTGGLGFTFLDEPDDVAASPRRGPETATGTGGPPDQSSTPRRPTPDGPPPTPGRAPTAPSSPSTGSHGSQTRSQDPSGSSTDPGRSRPGSSGSLWGDPSRSHDDR